MNCTRCGRQSFVDVHRCAHCSHQFFDGSDVVSLLGKAQKRTCLKPRNVVIFLAAWALLAVEIVIYAGKEPSSPKGWAALILLGPIAYVVLAACADTIFRSHAAKNQCCHDTADHCATFKSGFSHSLSPKRTFTAFSYCFDINNARVARAASAVSATNSGFNMSGNVLLVRTYADSRSLSLRTASNRLISSR